jgi:hypothetical protein
VALPYSQDIFNSGVAFVDLNTRLVNLWSFFNDRPCGTDLLGSVNEWMRMMMMSKRSLEGRRETRCRHVAHSFRKHQGDHRLNVPSEGRFNTNRRIPPLIQRCMERLISKASEAVATRAQKQNRIV